MEKAEFRVCGVLAAPSTAYNEQGEVVLEMIEKQAKALKANGMTGVFTTGTSGDGLSLTTEERKDVTAAWAKAAKSADLVQIAHVGHASVKEAQGLARHAAEVGVDAIAAIPPFYYKPQNVVNLVDTMAEIAAAAPKVPFYYYHIPSMTHVDVNVCDLVAHIEESGKIPTFRGMKYTATDLGEVYELSKCHNCKYNILVGGDDMLLAALTMGADGSIGAGYNVDSIGQDAAKVYKHFHEGNLTHAMFHQQKLMLFMGILKKFPDGALKAAVSLSGIDLGPERLPKRALDKEQRKSLDDEMVHSGLHG